MPAFAVAAAAAVEFVAAGSVSSNRVALDVAFDRAVVVAVAIVEGKACLPAVGGRAGSAASNSSDAGELLRRRTSTRGGSSIE
jgi:hypothetical protein